jgi:capsular exopolysaccharide synthesis family protein
MQLKDVLEAVKRFRLLAAAVVVVFVGIGIVAVYLPKKSYKATATLIAQPSNTSSAASSVPTIQFLLPSVVQQVGTLAFQDAVLTRAPTISSAPDLSINAALVAGTGIITITAQSRDRQVVVAASNAAAKELVARRLSPLLQLQLLDPAHQPELVATSKGPILGAALVLGLMAALLAALAANALRRAVVEEADLEPMFGLEILGEVPKRDVSSSAISTVFSNRDLLMLSEAFQKIVANLQTAGILATHHEIAIVSGSGDEGKTTVASGLAFALALNGHETLLIDTDLRKPTLHTRFGVARSPGLGDSQTHGSDPKLRHRVRSNLSVVTAGRTSQHPTTIVTRKLPELLRNSESGDQIVIVDTPPLASVPETILICHLVSGVIIVVEPGHTERAVLQRVLHDFRRADVEVLGVVLNRVERSSSRRRYASYYDETFQEDALLTDSADDAPEPRLSGVAAKWSSARTEESRPHRA